MKYIWNYIDRKDWEEKTKYQVTLWSMSILAGIIGFLIWLIVRTWFFKGWDAFFCFIGYPVVITWFAVVFYSFRHDFHTGSYNR